MNEGTTRGRPPSVGKPTGHDSERCDRCNRRLKDPESRRIGVGPICRKRQAREA
jgi:hypothetical protein